MDQLIAVIQSKTWTFTLRVDAFVQALYKFFKANIEGVTDSQDRGNSDRPASFNLLPMPGRKAKRDHVFLAQTLILTQFADAVAERAKEFVLIYHA